MNRRRSVPAGQLALFNAPETPDAFRKAVQVVHSKPKSPLSLLHRKLGNAWLKHAVENQPDADGWWELGIKKLAENIGFDSNNRQYLKESAEALMRVVFEWDVIAPLDKRVQWKASVLFPEIEIRHDAIRYQISSQMREQMINPEIYAMIDMNVVRRFRRASSLAIWEFCVRFERIGRTAEVQWQTFRDMVLGESAENTTYQEYKYFKSKVINPAIAEINAESNHSIGLVEERIGKRVTTIRFEIARKPGPETATETDRSEFADELTRLGLPRSEARKLLTDYSAEQLRGAIDYTTRRLGDTKLPRLMNPAAYFRQALAQRYAATTEPVPGAVSRARPVPAVDIKELYAGHQAREAEDYFAELDGLDQEALVDSYNTQQTAQPLRLSARRTRVAQAAFFRWLATETWGEPGPDELLEFAQRMLTSGNGVGA